MQISENVRSLARQAEKELYDIFCDIDEIARTNTERVLDSFRANSVSEAMFSASTGYGYGDFGRDAIDRIATEVFGGEAGFMRTQIISGTHALAVGLYGLLRPGDTMLSVTGAPYDTLREIIGDGIKNGDGSLADFGISYKGIDLIGGSAFDYPAIKAALADPSVKVVFVQRSKGYLDRATLTSEQIGELCRFVRSNSGDSRPYIVVDNCYGEFTQVSEPTSFGADMIIGSLIKNAGGGMADIGGYIVGQKRAVELAAYRLTTVGVGLEAGASLGQNRNILRGLFYAPHTVAQAMKTAHLAAYMFEKLGFDVSPSPFERRGDIIQTIKFGRPEGLISFCRGIQSASPVDAHVTPEPWAMPGYEDEVIMAAGAFVGGASIEISADGPLRPPYIAYLQGALTYESGRLAIMRATELLSDMK